MKKGALTAVVALLLFATHAPAANPFLDAVNDKPVSAIFRGTEWSDEIGAKEIPLSARAVTTRIAQMPWGAVFKIEFRDLKSRARTKREILPAYYVVTGDHIVLLTEDDNELAAKKLATLDQPPEFSPGDINGIADGNFVHEDGPWTNRIEVKGDRCAFSATHNSGHFKTVVWQKGVGLVEYSNGYGAHADGYRLKRVKS